MVDINVDDFSFSSNFDSGNLADVQCEDPDLSPSDATGSDQGPSTPVNSGIPFGSRRSSVTPAITSRSFFLWIAPDCAGTSHENGQRSWFYFSVSRDSPEARQARDSPRDGKRTTPVTRRAPQALCRFTIVNLAATNRIFDYDNRPVFRTEANEKWQRLQRPLDVVIRFPDGSTKTLSDASQLATSAPPAAGSASSYARRITRKLEKSTLRISWTFSLAPGDTAYFAMCYPYSYKHQLGAVDRWQARATEAPGGAIYFTREVLALSLQGRIVELLTITGNNGAAEEREEYYSGTAPVRSPGSERPFRFPEKRYMLVTARVHPGETPASHVLQGFTDFLLSNDARAAHLRKNFVFKIVPMINPDGVAQGHYRTDSRGINLNRCYDEPTLDLHPTIHAIRDTFLWLTRNTVMCSYIDLHAHASKRGCFVFANAWDNMDTQIENMLFPKVMATLCPHFDFPSCDFTSRSMTTKNRRDGVTKEGTGRVALATEAKLVQTYTFEVSYNTSLPSSTATDRRNYTTEVYSDIGRGMALALQEVNAAPTASRLTNTPFKDLDGVRAWIASQLREFYASESTAAGALGSGAVPGQRRQTKRKAREALSTKLALPSLNAAACRGRQLSMEDD